MLVCLVLNTSCRELWSLYQAAMAFPWTLKVNSPTTSFRVSTGGTEASLLLEVRFRSLLSPGGFRRAGVLTFRGACLKAAFRNEQVGKSSIAGPVLNKTLKASLLKDLPHPLFLGYPMLQNTHTEHTTLTHTQPRQVGQNHFLCKYPHLEART